MADPPRPVKVRLAPPSEDEPQKKRRKRADQGKPRPVLTETEPNRLHTAGVFDDEEEVYRTLARLRQASEAPAAAGSASPEVTNAIKRVVELLAAQARQVLPDRTVAELLSGTSALPEEVTKNEFYGPRADEMCLFQGGVQRPSPLNPELLIRSPACVMGERCKGCTWDIPGMPKPGVPLMAMMNEEELRLHHTQRGFKLVGERFCLLCYWANVHQLMVLVAGAPVIAARRCVVPARGARVAPPVGDAAPGSDAYNPAYVTRPGQDPGSAVAPFPVPVLYRNLMRAENTAPPGQPEVWRVLLPGYRVPRNF